MRKKHFVFSKHSFPNYNIKTSCYCSVFSCSKLRVFLTNRVLKIYNNSMVKAIILFLFFTLSGYGQTFFLSPDSSLFINANHSVSFDGLELAPNSAYFIPGPNTIDRPWRPLLKNRSLLQIFNILKIDCH